MKPLAIRDVESVLHALHNEIRRSEDSRYYHRLHGVLLVAQGLSCRRVSELLRDAPRTVAYWVRRFEAKGLRGLAEEERSGRPRRLNEEQIRSLASLLHLRPADFGLKGNLWDGRTLSAYVEAQWHIALGARQCQRIFRRLGYPLRKAGRVKGSAGVEGPTRVRESRPATKARDVVS